MNESQFRLLNSFLTGQIYKLFGIQFVLKNILQVECSFKNLKEEVFLKAKQEVGKQQKYHQFTNWILVSLWRIARIFMVKLLFFAAT